MPIVKKEYFDYKGEDNAAREIQINLKVDSTGLFYADIPAFVLPNVKSLWSAEHTENGTAKWQHNTRKTGGAWQVQASNLDLVKSVLTKALKEYSSPVEHRSWVIAYLIETRHWLPTDEETGEVRRCHGMNNLIAHHTMSGMSNHFSYEKKNDYDGYMVGVSAIVVQKLVTTRGSFSKTEYVTPTAHRDREVSERGDPHTSDLPCDLSRELNTYKGLEPKSSDRYSMRNRVEGFDSRVKIVPYDVDALNTIMAMVHATARLAEMVDSHFGEGNLPKINDVNFLKLGSS